MSTANLDDRVRNAVKTDVPGVARFVVVGPEGVRARSTVGLVPPSGSA